MLIKLFLLQVIQPVPTPIYFVCAWTLIAVLLCSIWAAFRDGAAQLQGLHQIKCSGCVYFTRDYRLKCTVHPDKALIELAINCRDYEPTIHPATTCSKRCKQ